MFKPQQALKMGYFKWLRIKISKHLHDKSSQNPSPAVNFKHGISLKRFRYLLVAFHFRAEIGRLCARKKNCEPGEGYVKICRVKKHVWEREPERALVDVTGTGKTVPSCREK